MYKTAARAMIRRNIKLLNEGRYEPSLKMFAPDATLTFPGDNSWSRQCRIPQTGREASPTHQSRSEIEMFVKRYTKLGIQMQVEDILVNGPPWNMRVALRVHDWIPGSHGVDAYANRAVLWTNIVWGKIRSQEDYEDTERVAAFDRQEAAPRSNNSCGTPDAIL